MQFTVSDAVSVTRAVMSLFLLVLTPLSDGFLALFALCAATDMLDGPLARRYGETPHGQALDSICDAVLALVMLICLVPNIPWEQWMIWWMASIACLRLISVGVGSARFDRPGFIHTYFNKAAGLLLFLSPFMLRLMDTSLVVTIVCSVASLSAIEFLYLNCTLREFDGEYPGLLFAAKT